MATLPKPLPKNILGAKPPASKPALVRESAKRRLVQHAPIAAAKAKTHFLQLLDQVERDRTPITITKRGRVVARIVPVASEPGTSALEEIFGRTKGMLTITGDIVSPDWESWGPQWR